jgi:hypothetical protein
VSGKQIKIWTLSIISTTHLISLIILQPVERPGM